MYHPLTRLRRTKKHEWSRDLFIENHVRAAQLMLPIFITTGHNRRIVIPTMPDVEIMSLDLCVDLIKRARGIGINNIFLFPHIGNELKDANASYAIAADNLVCKAVAAIKQYVPGIGVTCDIALDPYTIHGHDGIIDAAGYVLNDQTVAILCKQAQLLAEAGCDVLAPSDMMDGRIIAIRKLLEEKQLSDVQIFSYSAKYASKFYGPFRQIVGPANIKKLDKKQYQLNPANVNEALMKVALDVSEGADAVIVKPASCYLDIIKVIKQSHHVPVIAYQVSGEYAMLKFAAQHGVFDYMDAQLEVLVSYNRAGASAIITYAALEVAAFLSQGLIIIAKLRMRCMKQ